MIIFDTAKDAGHEGPARAPNRVFIFATVFLFRSSRNRVSKAFWTRRYSLIYMFTGMNIGLIRSLMSFLTCN